MNRALCLCLVLGLAGCSKPEEKSQAGRPPAPPRPTSSTAQPARPVAKARPGQTPAPRVAAQDEEVEAYFNDPPIPLTAPELLKAYENEAAADQRFKDHKVWLTGYVLRVARTGIGIPYVELAPGQGESGLVRCFFDKGRGLTVDALQENQEVTIEGEVSSKGANQEVRVDNCRILPRAFVQAVTEEIRRRKGGKE